MSWLKLVLEHLRHYARTNLAILLGVMVGSAVLTGSLLVGDSMKGTLRSLTLERLGQTQFALVGPKFFRQDLAERWNKDPKRASAAAVILIRGSVIGVDEARASSVQIVGTTPEFWTSILRDEALTGDAASKVIINEELARATRAKEGDRLAVNFETVSEIPREGLLGKRDETIRSIPLVVDQVIPNRGAGRFSLEMTQKITPTLFVPIETLANYLEQKGRANALLVANAEGSDPTAADAALSELVTLDDMGLRLVPAENWVSIETRERVLSESLADAILAVCAKEELVSQPVMSYLANTIAGGGKEIPYSVVTGIAFEQKPPFGPLPLEPALESLSEGEIILNRWSADRLGVKVGDEIRLDYFHVADDSSLENRSQSFRLVAVAAMEGLTLDQTLTPDYPGITDANTFAGWEAPFPFEIDRITAADEDYWKQYRTAPKAFVSLSDAQRLWATRFGNTTSIRVAPPIGTSTADFSLPLGPKIRAGLNAADLGFTFLPIRQMMLTSSSGSTDFGMLFISMSFFLIVSAALLVGVLFRLATEQRGSSMGILLAVGWTVGQVRRLLLAEGSVIAAIGALLGLPAAVAYAWGIIQLLGSWWRDAVGTSFIEFHATPMSFAIGWLASVLVPVFVIALSTRRISKVPVPTLLTEGFSEQAGRPARRSRWLTWLAWASLSIGVGLVIAGGVGAISQVGAFFGGGTLVLLAGLFGWAGWLGTNRAQDPVALVRGSGTFAMARIGARNTSRRPSRSLTTGTLLALAVFLVASVGTMRHGQTSREPRKDSGNGGFTLVARSASPLPRDLNDADGRFAMNVSDEVSEILAQTETYAFRVHAGDDASCLNIYQPTKPTLLGAPPPFLERGGFAFASTLAQTSETKANPWQLLDVPMPEGVVAAIGDAATLQWILKVPVGAELVMTDEAGRPLRVRIVAGLSDSIFQGQLVVSDSALTRHFPSNSGRQFFLFAPPAESAERLAVLLEKDLADFGFDMERTADLIEQFMSVQETYMSAFQTLGGLGLILGTLGLGAVLARNVFERRGEFALLSALGIRPGSIALMVLAETSVLLLAGLCLGLLAAAIAVLPQLIKLKDWSVMIPLAGLLAGMMGVGLLSGAAAVWQALRVPVIPSLRAERG